MCIKIKKIGKQEVGIWWIQKRFPRYGVPILSLWPNIRFLPSIVAEKNATKNEHICSMCIKINKVGKQEVGIRWVQKRFPWYGVLIWSLCVQGILRHIFLSNYWWQKSDIWSQASYRYPISWQAFLDPSDSYFLFADLIFIPAINSCWEKCAYMFNGYKYLLSRQTGSRNLTGPKMLPTIWYTYMMLVTKYQISAINS
jgi:hypothetical protein